jgi:hypothetical protein
MSGDIDNPELREYESSRGVALLAKPFDIETVADTVRRIAALRNATSP